MSVKKIEIRTNLGKLSDFIDDDGDCIIYFDNGESCKWSQSPWPNASATHFSRIQELK